MKVVDCVGREIKAGCQVKYPVRRGSDMWLKTLNVQQVHLGEKPHISGYNELGRRVYVHNLEYVIVVVPLTHE